MKALQFDSGALCWERELRGRNSLGKRGGGKTLAWFDSRALRYVSVAEWLGTGLQPRQRRFGSALALYSGRRPSGGAAACKAAAIASR